MNLKEALKNLVFKEISKIAEEMNAPVFVIGGFVRDFLLNRRDKKDVDIVIEGSGIELAQKIAQNLPGSSKIKVFKRFGTAMFRYKDIDWEFVGARKESYSENSRKPAVENGSIEDDQMRRDFTINALAISLNESNYGEFIDPFGGFQDLENKIIRTPLAPEITYSDDPLRMMRAIRFAAQLDFDIEAKSFQAIKENAQRMEILSKERVMAEFNKIMLTRRPSYGLKLLEKSGLLDFILPELLALKGIEEIDGQTHKDNFWHTLEVVDNISQTTGNLWLRWAALLHDIGKAPTKKFDKKIGWTFHNHEFVGSKLIPGIFRRLRLPMGGEMKYVKKMVMLSSRPIPLISDEVSDSALRRLLFDAGDDLEDLFLLCKADITTKNKTKQQRFQQNFEKVERKIIDLEERDQIRNFQPPVSGEDIMQLFDIQPCREVGVLKNKIKEAILDGKIENERNAALVFMEKEGGELGLKLAKTYQKS